MKSPYLIRHLNGKSGKNDPLPVWMMRQAGRYLPSYREIRKNHSFWEMVTQPELAAQVTLLPFKEIQVDAAIFFSDILTLPYGLQIPIQMKEKIGPVVTTPLRTRKDFEVFNRFDPTIHTQFVASALSMVRKDLAPEKALIGFAGAPWTVSCYLIEGQGKNGFPQIQEWMTREPETLIQSLELLSQATVRYLQSQVESGAQLLQLFDTWASSMSQTFFTAYYLPLLKKLFQKLSPLKVPLIYFAKNLRPVEMLRAVPCDILGIDYNVSLSEADAATGGMFSLQGNFNPNLLLGSEENVRSLTRSLVKEARKLTKPPIINLGHGIFPETPLENAKAFVEEARQCSSLT